MFTLGGKKFCGRILILFFIIFTVKEVGAATYPVIYPNRAIQENQSAFGRLGGPISYNFPYTETTVMINDRSTWNDSSTFQFNGYHRNLGKISSDIISPTTQLGYDYMRFTGLYQDQEGLEDENWDFALCNGAYPDPIGLFEHTCYKGWPLRIGGLSDNTMNVHEYDEFLLYRDDTTDPSYIRQASIHANTYATSTYSDFTQPGLDYDFKLIGKKSCTPKNVCVNANVLRYRDGDCTYADTWTTCDGICQSGQCDPATLPPANISTNPITPASGSGSSPILVTSGGGLLQCKDFTGTSNSGYYDGVYKVQEIYSVADSYQINLSVPSGVDRLYYWTALDTADSILPNQQENYGTYDSIIEPAEGNRSFDLWPSGSNSGYMTYFRNEDEARKASYGVFGRGDSFVLQLQALHDEGSGYSQTVGVSTPPTVSQPTYFNYTYPSYAQCAPPDEVIPTIEKAAPTCADTTNTVSWDPVTGADKYMVLVSTNPNLSVYSPSYYDYLTATTTDTSYTFQNPRPEYAGPYYNQYLVKVYAYGTNGWNISNTSVNFTAPISSSCSTIPSTPTGLSVTAQPYCGGGNDVTWGSVSNATGYRVYRATSLNGTYTEITGTNGTTSTSYIDSSVNPSTTYYYKVLAFNANGSSAQSSADSAISPAVCSYTGSVEITRYGTDLSTPTSAPEGTEGKLGNLDAIASNPAIFSNVEADTLHYPKVTNLSGYGVKMTSCSYATGDTECNIPEEQFADGSPDLISVSCDVDYCVGSVYVPENTVVKVGAMYTPSTGSIRVSHYGEDLSEWESPDLPPNLWSKIDATDSSELSDNPHMYENITIDYHTIYVPDLSSTHGITYGTCSYIPQDLDCPLEEWDFWGTPDCDGTHCAISYIDAYSGITTKVGVRYVGTTSVIPTPIISGPTSGFVNTYYPFTAVSSASGQALQGKPSLLAQVANIFLAQQQPTQLKYGFDWDNDFVVEEGDWHPGSSIYTDIGTSVEVMKSWTNPALYSFNVIARDNQGQSSEWASSNITIRLQCSAGAREYLSGGSCSVCPGYRNYNAATRVCARCPDGTFDNGVTACDPSSLLIDTFNINPNVVYPGDQCNITLSVEGAATCTVEGSGATYPITLDVNGYYNDSFGTSQINSTTKFKVTCSPLEEGIPNAIKYATCSVNPLLRER